MRLTAKYGGQCRECQREVLVGDDIEWSMEGGASHASCAEGGEPPPGRRVGTAAEARPLDLPHHPEPEGPIDWATWRPKDRK